MPRLLASSTTDALDALARGQGGFVLRRQLVAMGLPRSTISGLTRTAGRWQRVMPGTYFVHQRPLTVDERETGVLLYAGAGGVLTGTAALRHFGMRYLPEDPALAPVHVLIGQEASRTSRGMARIERTWRLPKPVLLHGKPVAPLARALFDSARHVPDRRLTRALILEALQNERIAPAQLEFELAAGQRRWTALMRDALREFRSGSVSAPEAEFREGWESRGLPTLLWNPTILTEDEEFIASPDGYDEETGMAVEMHSMEFHTGRRVAATFARHRRMAGAGLVVVPLVPFQLRADPGRVYAEVMATRSSLVGRPPPAVIVRRFSAP